MQLMAKDITLSGCNAVQLSMYGEHVIPAQGSVHLSDINSLKLRYP